MEIHVGIYPGDGKLSYYNETEKKTVNLTITEVGTNEIEKVNSMFKEIKAKINEELGFLCIFLKRFCRNEICKSFIEEGLKIGFKNVEIINMVTAYYLNPMSQIKYKPLNGNIIWIYWNNCFWVWKINDKKANLIGEWKADSSKLNELQKIVTESKLEKRPDIVVYFGTIDETNVRKVSADCEFFSYNIQSHWVSNACLLKARITFGDSDLFHLDIQQFLSFPLTLKIGDKEIISFPEGQKLPIFYSQKKESSDKELKIQNFVFTDVIQLSEHENVKFNFKIDKNQIYSVDFLSKVVYVNHKNVIISDNENVTTFPASIDYGFQCPKVGVNYRSPTVINNIIDNFGVLTNKNTVPLREYCFSNEIKRFYVLKLGKNKRLIDEEKVVVDLFEEAIKKSGISKEKITLIIPTNFSTAQKTGYLKAAEIAGFTDIISVDEQVALAFGYETQENAPTPDTEYLLINFCETVIKITVNKVGDFDKENCPSKTIDIENFELSKLAFFDKIISDASETTIKENNENANFETYLQSFFDAINDLISDNISSIVISPNEFCSAILHDKYPNFNICVIQNYEELTVNGAAFA